MYGTIIEKKLAGSRRKKEATKNSRRRCHITDRLFEKLLDAALKFPLKLEQPLDQRHSSQRAREIERARRGEREEGFNFSQRGRVARDYGHLQKGRRRRQRGWKQRNRFFVSRVWRPPPPPPILYPYTSPTPFNAFTTFPIEIKRSPRSRVGWCKMKDDGGGREVWQKRRGRG